ncbi:hypothetical protein D6D22_07177 [Aureobasidium pullulans]|uniref:Phosphoglycerate mutase-like protein n=1 Tax=Aureobasidium pullulans TaxID=5580 RepID=A0A4S8XCL4_AURPU|nr:hypothetical protein D6D22_07177 [Aureobasidium pullulans]
MAPRVHLIRHAEGYHQLEPTQKNELLHDPDLTLAGVANCKQFASSFPEYIRLDLICSSPMRRAIQTAKYCFPSQLERDGPLLLVPLAQENTDLPCDTGSNPAALMQEFGNLVDASMVEEGWNSKTGIYASAPAALEERARQFRAWLKQRPEQDVAVVGHGVFWHYVTGSVDASGNQTAVRGMAIQERRTITRSHEDNNGDNCAIELSKEYDICMARKEGYAFWYARREEAAGAVVQNASCSWAKCLQGAQAGLAIDYYKKSFVFRIRVEGYQFLCATGSFAAAIGWVDALNAAIAVSADLDERKEPIYQTMASIRTPGTRNIKTKMSGTTTFRQMLNWRKYNINGAWLRDQEGEHSRMGLKRYLEDEEQLLADHSAAVQQTFAAHCFRSACFGSAKTAVSPDSNHSASTRMQCGPDNVAALDAKEMADYNAWQDSRIELAWKRLEYARRCAKTLTLRDSWVDNRYLRGRAWVVMPPKKRSPTPALPD